MWGRAKDIFSDPWGLRNYSSVFGYERSGSLKFVSKNYEIKIDELVVTSGIGGTFPKGLPIGKVSKVTKNPRGMFQEIEVTSEVDFNRLEYVIILLAENPLAL